MRNLLALALVGTPLWAQEPDPERLERLVHQDCGSCHGMTLKGGLGPELRRQTLAHYDREALAGVILNGIPGTPMPPWAPLMSNAEALWIAEYILKGAGE
ncbi:cytochrome c [Sedimentitalea sp. XS_ASV28]|uniref:c-type cytochrome n=1 Tax=Sedimentitalea sp. XS_ASV28 TaxID=3241296 RepID=UPI003511E318